MQDYVAVAGELTLGADLFGVDLALGDVDAAVVVGIGVQGIKVCGVRGIVDVGEVVVQAAGIIGSHVEEVIAVGFADVRYGRECALVVRGTGVYAAVEVGGQTGGDLVFLRHHARNKVACIDGRLADGTVAGNAYAGRCGIHGQIVHLGAACDHEGRFGGQGEIFHRRAVHGRDHDGAVRGKKHDILDRGVVEDQVGTAAHVNGVGGSAAGQGNGIAGRALGNDHTTGERELG